MVSFGYLIFGLIRLIVCMSLKSPTFYALLGPLYLYKKELFVGKNIIATVLFALIIHTIIASLMIYYKFKKKRDQYKQYKEELCKRRKNMTLTDAFKIYEEAMKDDTF